jgi:hypothetical protein
MYPIGTKLGVNELFYQHVGTYYGNGLVLHNHQKNGAELVSLQEFSNGKNVALLEGGVNDVYAFFNRIHHVLASGQPYDFIKNNCEHTVSYVREGVARSPQLIFCGIISLCAVGAYVCLQRASS